MKHLNTLGGHTATWPGILLTVGGGAKWPPHNFSHRTVNLTLSLLKHHCHHHDFKHFFILEHFHITEADSDTLHQWCQTQVHTGLELKKNHGPSLIHKIKKCR